jgi:crotonobetainyl-CoA:carnitine CoA-transferase CaiB-like acyl-CoA transferase
MSEAWLWARGKQSDLLRVVEVADGTAGAVCGRLFAGLGHDVVKVEAAGGDPLRSQPPLNAAGTSLAFTALNADKQSVAGRDEAALAALLAQADVLVLDVTPGAAAALGLAPERLRESWPRLIVVWITAFGREGELSEMPGDSLLAESYGGIATMIGAAGQRPLSLGGEQVAYCAGVTGFLGAQLALIRRDAGEPGDLVDVAMCDVAAYMDWKGDVAYHMTGSALQRASLDSGEWRLVRAADGYVGFIFLQRHWAGVVELVDAPELRDPRLAVEAIRLKEGPRWWPVVERWAAALPAEEIYVRAQRLGLPFGWVVPASGLLASRQLRERGFTAPVPGAGLGLVPAVGAPAHCGQLPWRSGQAPGAGSAARPWSAPDAAWPQAAPPHPAQPAAADGPQPAWAPPGGPLRPGWLLAGQGQPLRGVVVLDFGTITAGAAVTRLLADHGATVVKVEWTDKPDTFRSWKMPDGDKRESPYFPSNNVGKLDVGINLKTEQGRDLVRQLARHAHVVVENYRVGVTKRLGIDDESLRAINPDLIYLSLSSQGQHGPEAGNSSFGSTLDLLSGLASLTGYDAGHPIWSSSEVNYPDQLVSLVGAAFIAYCLRSGRSGVSLDVSQREVVSWTLAASLAEYLVTGRDSAPAGNARPGRAPHDTYRSGDDGWVAISCATDAERAALAGLLGGGELAGQDAAWWDAHAAAVSDLISRWTIARGRDAAAAELRAAGVPAVPVLTAADRAVIPRFRERQVTFDTSGPPVKGFPVLFRDYEPPVHLKAPAVGEHTREVLTEVIGLSLDELGALEAQGVIHCAR